MASVALKNFAVVLMVAICAAAVATVSAQDFGELAPAPVPNMDKGAGHSLGMSAAVICSSLFFSVLALLKH